MKKNYYVYLHKNTNGLVYYVGKGTGKRAQSKAYRSPAWHKESLNGYSIEIFADNLLESEALAIEANLITTLPYLVNKRVFTKLEFDDLAEYFKIEPTVPSGLIRIKGTWTGCYEKGVLGPIGYIQKRDGEIKGWVLTHRGSCISVHRIVWQIANGIIPLGMVVDHIDGNPLNNNLDNLRLVDAKTNSRNKKQYKNNSSGVTGVLKVATGFVACWRDVCSQERRKTFSSKTLGNDEAFRLACEHRQQMIAELNLQGAGYTERHGT